MVVLFTSNKHPFSNFYPASYNLYDIVFPTSEHGFMWEKAYRYGNYQDAQKILNAKTPMAAKKIGRRTNIDVEDWKNHRYEIMKKHVEQKFAQNDDIADRLVETQGQEIMEASPWDNVWGIGISQKQYWSGTPPRGQNLLGKILMELRDEMIVD